MVLATSVGSWPPVHAPSPSVVTEPLEESHVWIVGVDKEGQEWPTARKAAKLEREYHRYFRGRSGLVVR